MKRRKSTRDCFGNPIDREIPCDMPGADYSGPASNGGPRRRNVSQKQVYRIEIPSKGIEGFTFVYWIGRGGELVSNLFDAVPCTEDEHLLVMERINCEATAFIETGKFLLRCHEIEPVSDVEKILARQYAKGGAK